MQDILIITPLPLNNRNFDRFGIKYFNKKGFNLKIIYLERSEYILNSKVSNKFINNKIKIFKINNLFKLYKLLKFNNKFYYIDFMFYDWQKLIINFIFYLKGNIRLILNLNTLPHNIKGEKTLLFDRIKNVFRSKYADLYFMDKLKNLLFYNLQNYLDKNFFKNKTYLVYSGRKSKLKYKVKYEIKSHAYDLDLFRNNKKKVSKYIVFIDTYEENHPEDLFLKIKPVNKKLYFNSLNLFLNKIEKITKKKIIIAAHPSSPKTKTRYVGRKLIYNKTSELIKNSIFCISHSTTAANFACIYKKPIIFIYSNELLKKKINFTLETKLQAKAFGNKAVNIDKEFSKKDISQLLKINNKNYLKYFENYISLEKETNKYHSIELMLRKLNGAPGRI